MQIKNSLKAILFFSLFSIFISCGDNGTDEGKETNVADNTPIKSKRAGKNDVIVKISSNPDRMNPITSTDAYASQIQFYLFESMTTVDRKTLEVKPVLAKELAKMEEITVDAYGTEKEGLKFTYEIREEANWNDGTPITGHDAAFYLKCIKNPKVDCESSRPYFEAIIDIEVDKTNSKIFSVIFQDKYFTARELSNMGVLQRSIYDENGYMEKFSVKDLSNPNNQEKLNSDENINLFAKSLNSEKFSRELVSGSGPYTFKHWETGQQIVLIKNENWWAKDLVDKYDQLNNYPDKIVYKIIKDETTAVTSQKDEEIDLMKHAPKYYDKLKDNNDFLSLYKFEKPMSPGYSYIGLNTKNTKLADKRVRQALSMAVNYQKIIDIYLYGLAKRTHSPIHPDKPFYNNTITPYPFNLQKASDLLTEAGWIDEDEDGVREKEIDGEEFILNLEFKYSSGSEIAKNMALIMKDDFKKIGINLEIVNKEWTVFLQDVKSHNFDMITMGWSMGPGLPDLKQIWHQDSYDGGSNYTGFGNEHTDDLIDKIRYELDETARNKMYTEMQEIIHDEAPYIFLFTSKSLIAMHKRFDNAEGYPVRPGFNVAKFQLNPAFGSNISKPTVD